MSIPSSDISSLYSTDPELASQVLSDPNVTVNWGNRHICVGGVDYGSIDEVTQKVLSKNIYKCNEVDLKMARFLGYLYRNESNINKLSEPSDTSDSERSSFLYKTVKFISDVQQKLVLSPQEKQDAFIASLKDSDKIEIEAVSGQEAKKMFDEVSGACKQKSLLELTLYDTTNTVISVREEIRDTMKRGVFYQFIGSDSANSFENYSSFCPAVQNKVNLQSIQKWLDKNDEDDEDDEANKYNFLAGVFLGDLSEKLGVERRYLIGDISKSLEQSFTNDLVGAVLGALGNNLQYKPIKKEMKIMIPSAPLGEVVVTQVLDFSKKYSSLNISDIDDGTSRREFPFGIRATLTITLRANSEEGIVSYRIQVEKVEGAPTSQPFSNVYPIICESEGPENL